jgi:hypothetical protein
MSFRIAIVKLIGPIAPLKTGNFSS